MRYNTQDIITWVRDLFVGKVCDRIYSTNIPTNLTEPDNQMFMVVSVIDGEDMNAYVMARVNIELFLKSPKNGYMNVSEMARLESLIMDIIDTANEDNQMPYTLISVKPIPIKDFDAERQYHVYSQIFKVLVKRKN